MVGSENKKNSVTVARRLPSFAVAPVFLGFVVCFFFLLQRKGRTSLPFVCLLVRSFFGAGLSALPGRFFTCVAAGTTRNVSTQQSSPADGPRNRPWHRKISSKTRDKHTKPKKEQRKATVRQKNPQNSVKLGTTRYLQGQVDPTKVRLQENSVKKTRYNFVDPKRKRPNRNSNTERSPFAKKNSVKLGTSRQLQGRVDPTKVRPQENSVKKN